jgi:hypothetical protein
MADDDGVVLADPANPTLSLLTEGSTQPVSSRVTHAGIARVAKFVFLID